VPLVVLFIVLGVVAAFAAINLGVFDRRPSVRPGPATDELFDEPPAIVALLTNGFRPSPAAAPATLADLVARGVLRVDGTAWRPGSAYTEMLAYERAAFDLIPASGEAVTWPELRVACTETEFIQAFQTAVVTDAASRGLLRPTLQRTTSGRAEVALPRAQRPTPVGKEAASRWLGVRVAMAAKPAWRTRGVSAAGEHGRRLAYAIALGLTPTTGTGTGASAPTDAAPAHAAGPADTVVLAPRGSSTTTPRDVLTRYLLLATAGCLFGIGFLTAGLLGWAGPAVAGLVVVVAFAGAGRGLADILAPRTIEGTIIRKVLLHYDPYGPEELGTTLGGAPREVSPVSWVAIDDGQSKSIRGVRLHPDIADHLAVGDVVRARIAPRVCWLYSITVVGREPQDRTSSSS
jgi:hypothetical protein